MHLGWRSSPTVSVFDIEIVVCRVANVSLIYRHRESIKRDTRLLSSPNIDRFSNSGTIRRSKKFAIKLPLKIPPHLKCVATLPCEILQFNFKNRSNFSQSLMVSVGVSESSYTSLYSSISKSRSMEPIIVMCYTVTTVVACHYIRSLTSSSPFRKTAPQHTGARDDQPP